MPTQSRRLYLLATIALLWLAAPPALAERSKFVWGPDIGSEIPHSLEALDASGRAVDFEDVAGPRGTALFFFRSADWCRFCQRQLIELNEQVAEFSRRGVNVVGISYDSPAVLAAFTMERNLGFTLLSDTGSEIIRAFGILNPRYEPGDSGYGIPNPGVVLVSPQRRVVATFAEKSYRKRPRIETLLAAIDATPGDADVVKPAQE